MSLLFAPFTRLSPRAPSTSYAEHSGLHTPRPIPPATLQLQPPSHRIASMSNQASTPLSGSAESSPDGRLDSWKEIAAYLRREVRTVQRWEKSSGLPVHRLQIGKQGSVYAHKAELDAWYRDRRPDLDSDSADKETRSLFEIMRMQ